MLRINTARRDFLTAGAGIIASATFPRLLSAQSNQTRDYILTAAQSNAYFQGGPYPPTPVWCYDGKIPGPVIRAVQGEHLRIKLDNQLTEPTTLHCHGIRMPNPMDGVPHLTQAPIEAGESFIYEFDLPDAGTFWYHPHFNSSEQVGRGLSGALIVEEREPVAVDRDLVLVLDDWRVTEQATISESFKRMRDMSHAGRIGNTVTVNGRIEPNINVRSGERLRLRLINASNARAYALDFSATNIQVIAIDGQPVEPHVPDDGLVILGAAMRADVVVDVMQAPGDSVAIVDRFYREHYDVFKFVYTEQSALRDKPLNIPVQLPANPLPEPNIDNAQRYDVVLAGGAMGRMRGAKVNGEWTAIRDMVEQGVVWAMNDEVGIMPLQKPFFEFNRNESVVLKIQNDTAFDHPMHLHGHSFRVLSRDGSATKHRQWQDTVLVMNGETVEIAFVADNPGDWMFHCHVLEHQESGMTSFIRVT